MVILKVVLSAGKKAKIMAVLSVGRMVAMRVFQLVVQRAVQKAV